jgi:hypothetical protein
MATREVAAIGSRRAGIEHDMESRAHKVREVIETGAGLHNLVFRGC